MKTTGLKHSVRNTFERPSKPEFDKVRVGGRNFVRKGDFVHVKPSKPGKQDGFDAKVLRIIDEASGIAIEVYGGVGGRAGIRTFPLDRIERLQQTRHGERVERRP